jgi:acyl-CoA synthetase (AMP-forming)/AMP-acid ligase II/acyl carrier protein
MRPACRIQPEVTHPRSRFGRDFLAFARSAMPFLSTTSERAPDSIGDLLRQRAAERPDQTAFVYISDANGAGGGEVAWTFSRLERRARAVAAALSRQAKPGDRAVLVFPPGLDFLAAFFGCLYAGVLPAPATYPKPRRRSTRLDSIVGDCTPAVGLTTAETLESLRLEDQTPAVRQLSWMAVDQCADANFEPVVRRRKDAAFLQYTSGSTSQPRGVVVTHGNLLHNLELISLGFGVSTNGEQGRLRSNGKPLTGAFWLPAYHDMGLIGGILTPLYVGGVSYLIAPAAFLQRPAAWLETLSRTGAEISGAPNFAYELCTRKVSVEERAALDLSKWRLAFCGAEPIDAATLAEFATTFAPTGFRSDAFYACYGLAEATLMVTGGVGPGFPRVIHADRTKLAAHQLVDVGASQAAQPIVSCGRPLGNQDVLIVDAKTRAVAPAGTVGEIWISGDSVAQGYWNQSPDASHAFGSRLNDGRGPFLRTGDLGAFHDGELFVTGRLKDVIIIRGRNLYPQDIERTVQQAHDAVELGAAFAVGEPGHEELVVVHQVSREHRRNDLAPVVRSIRAAIVDEHEVDPQAIVLLRPATLPLTSSGKVQRSRCRDLYFADDLEVVEQWTRPAESRAPASLNGSAGVPLRPKFLDHLATSTLVDLTAEMQSWMIGWLAEKVGIESEQLSPTATFAELGIDSLTAVELNLELEKVLGLRLPPSAAWSHPTPASLSQFLAQSLVGHASLGGPGGNVVDSWFAAMDADVQR